MLKKLPVALTIAGSDSGAGAGIQADLKTFTAFDVHGATVITCLTAQNPARVLAVEPVRAEMLRRQLAAIFQVIPPSAIKTGMLYSVENIRIVADFLKHKEAPLVVDPVMVSTSGHVLLLPDSLKALKDKLLPLAALVTPNLPEAEILGHCKIASVEDMDRVARNLHSEFGCAVLVKGGHLRGARDATDILYDGKASLVLTAPLVRNVRAHGAGCVYSAAICAALALGQDLAQSVQSGKQFITRSIQKSYRIGGHFALGH
ncbi:MAG: bifunctional hydroxymethylpyrimidine kinase/phosphomethylpyrimidine kinase [Limisphaerales bacterium]